MLLRLTLLAAAAAALCLASSLHSTSFSASSDVTLSTCHVLTLVSGVSRPASDQSDTTEPRDQRTASSQHQQYSNEELHLIATAALSQLPQQQHNHRRRSHRSGSGRSSPVSHHHATTPTHSLAAAGGSGSGPSTSTELAAHPIPELGFTHDEIDVHHELQRRALRRHTHRANVQSQYIATNPMTRPVNEHELTQAMQRIRIEDEARSLSSLTSRQRRRQRRQQQRRASEQGEGHRDDTAEANDVQFIASTPNSEFEQERQQFDEDEIDPHEDEQWRAMRRTYAMARKQAASNLVAKATSNNEAQSYPVDAVQLHRALQHLRIKQRQMRQQSHRAARNALALQELRRAQGHSHSQHAMPIHGLDQPHSINSVRINPHLVNQKHMSQLQQQQQQQHEVALLRLREMDRQMRAHAAWSSDVLANAATANDAAADSNTVQTEEFEFDKQPQLVAQQLNANSQPINRRESMRHSLPPLNEDSTAQQQQQREFYTAIQHAESDLTDTKGEAQINSILSIALQQEQFVDPRLQRQMDRLAEQSLPHNRLESELRRRVHRAIEEFTASQRQQRHHLAPRIEPLD